jgi:hypothetical protein
MHLSDRARPSTASAHKSLRKTRCRAFNSQDSTNKQVFLNTTNDC